MTPLIISPSDLIPAALANRTHELRRMRRPDRPTMDRLTDRHQIVRRRYLPDDDVPPTPAAPAMMVRANG
jgi:hypothetical protein